MFGLGTIVNVIAIVAGGLIGLLLKGGMKEHYQTAIIRTMGLATIFIGASGTLPGLLVVENGVLVSTPIKDTLCMILALALGTFIGEWLDFDGRLERLGAWLKEKATRGDDNRFIEGFVTASLTVCIGAMAIVGAIEDGIQGDPSILLTKSVLDLIIIAVMTCSMGKGCVFSAIPVAVLQGSVTCFAKLIQPIMTEAALANLSLVGSVLIFCVGINLVWDKRIRVANLLPAIVIAVAAAFLPI